MIDDQDYFFTCLITDALTHVKKFFYTRPKPPTLQEEVGEFVTVLRRFLRSHKYKINDNLNFLTNTSSWYAPGVLRNRYRCVDHLNNLCKSAMNISSSKTVEQTFIETNYRLKGLMDETASLEHLVKVAENLNSEASKIMDNLYTISTKLES